MDFVILKVNGTDVSSFPYEDAVNAFLSAQEPIVVEVKRRSSDSSACDSRPASSKLISTGVQTDLSGLGWVEEPSFECFTHDIDFEEVTLRKCSSDEKLGLTVCYSSGSEVDTYTEVYIQGIAPHSVADRDGRLRQGDQILQVNGKDVSNKEETESLFAENRKAVTLLVSRCMHQSNEGLDVESPADMLSPSGRSAAYQNSLIEQLVQQQAEYQHSTKSDAPIIPPHSQLNLTNSLTRTQMHMISHEISELDQRMQNIQLVKSDKRKAPQLPDIPAPLESDPEHIYETIPESVDSELEPIYSCPYEPQDDNIVEQWLKTQESGWVLPSKEEKSKEAKGKEGKTRSKSSKSNSSGEEHENSSSAYNTGGSCNSNPLTVELACSADPRQKDTYRSTLVLCPPVEVDETTKSQESVENCDVCKQQVNLKPKKTKASNSKVNSPSSPTTRPGLTVTHLLSDTMYTNVANLQQTMLLQQQLFRQALGQQNNDIACKPTTSFTAPSLSQYQFVSNQQTYKNQRESATMDTKMEWKVKRRSDGTRYIARRPVRNRILRNRAIRISEERAGLTTEDDTISELKIGKYWTKEERKKHLEKSRERKQRQEILLSSKNIEENCELVYQKPFDKIHSASAKKMANNLDNTAKKHKAKRVHKEGYHDFTTVQEMLVHGPKVIPNPSNKVMGLLSVTTV
ncbi:hypothetical protein ILUMI_22719 [Ignelater luminosus]|uniref:PDZ domain-containing protein n=1 Tax=Ignelater luminosus TaxID=2038154 RepID=A0A8K0G098_IGNLU|nr:hypothetical protein ILUMI_22719 [Ignelater luminosus]